MLLGGVEPVVTDRRDELAAVPDVISTDGDEDFSAFATSRWPGLVRLAFGLTGDRGLAEDMAQTALARAYVAWRRVSRADDPDAYVRRILVKRATAGSAGAAWPSSPATRPRRWSTVPRPGGRAGRRAGGTAPAAAPAARGDRAPVLGGPDRRADRRHPGLLAGHGAQPASRALAKLRDSPVLAEGNDP